MSTITLDYAPFPHQVELHCAPQRFKVIAGGRRSGKTKSSFQEILRYALSHSNSLCWWVSPTYNEAREVGFSEFEKYEEQLQPAILSANRTLMRVTFRNGSKLYFKGADRRDSLRGRGINFLSIDEIAFMEEETWTKILRPALADKQGQAVLTSSPDGKNWFYKLFQQASKPTSTYKAWTWTTYDNILISHDEIAAMKQELSTFDFRQEILAEFVSKSGQVYDDFNEDNIIKDFKPSQNHDIYIGADFGYANPTFLTFMAVDRYSGNVYQFAEIERSHTKIQIIIDEIFETLSTFGVKEVKAIYTDPAGNADEITSGESPVDVLRKHFTVHNIGSKIAPGLSLVRSYIKNAAGKRKFFISETCTKTIEAINGYVYAPATRGNQSIKEEPLKDGIHDHACDALRYFFVNCFPQNRYLTDDIKPKSYFVEETSKPIIKKCAKCYNPFVSKTPKDVPPFLCTKCFEEQ